MCQIPKSVSIPLSSKSLLKEVAAVFFIQLILVAGLVQLDNVFSLGGNLYSLVAVIFVLLPVIVLDRRGKPYERYGITWGKPWHRPFMDIVWVLVAVAIAFPPIVLGAPTVWGLDSPDWNFIRPGGYPGAALSHLVVVALPEEFFYRGYIMGRLDDILPARVKLLGARVGWSLPIQAVLFALGHYLVDFNPTRLSVFFPALAFGWLREKRGTIVAPILFHAASNIFMEIFRAGYGLA
ncbi:MAG: CPBP family intramembrane metalloprotease [Deltaproteobacteria bacterium]|nr:CPBP family intramembrane metalloprotease [Deltaproteobacteria bacterium]